MAWRSVALAVAGWIACAAPVHGEGPAPSGERVPIPDKAEADIFADAPAQWRDYLLRARAAARIEDPLQRCLAWPDLAGNRWPPGHVEANCRFRSIRVIGLADVEAYLDRGDVAGLERILSGYLDRHFSDTAHGEDIHVAMGHFSGTGAEVDRISARWLELAPRSAYARLARATHLHRLAHAARGGRWVSEVPAEDLRRMSELAGQAIPLYQQALAIEPRLMPAYAGLSGVARLDSRKALFRQTVSASLAQDPTCYWVADQRMTAATPRWGGSYEEMLSIAAELGRHVAVRPLLAIHMAKPYADRGDLLLDGKQYTSETVELLDIALRTGPDLETLVDAAELAQKLPPALGGEDKWKSLAMLLQHARFARLDAWAARNLGWYLMASEPEWSIEYATRAVVLDPANATGHYVLAVSYANTRQHDAAERHYLVAMEADQFRHAALRELPLALFYSDPDPLVSMARVEPYVDRLLGEFPEDGIGWLLRIKVQIVRNDGEVDSELLETFLEYADRDDPVQAVAVAGIEAELARLSSSSPASSP